MEAVALYAVEDMLASRKSQPGFRCKKGLAAEV